MATTKKTMTEAELRAKLRELGATPTIASGGAKSAKSGVTAYVVPTGGHIKATALGGGSYLVEAIGCKC